MICCPGAAFPSCVADSRLGGDYEEVKGESIKLFSYWEPLITLHLRDIRQTVAISVTSRVTQHLCVLEAARQVLYH